MRFTGDIESFSRADSIANRPLHGKFQRRRIQGNIEGRSESAFFGVQGESQGLIQVLQFRLAGFQLRMDFE